MGNMGYQLIPRQAGSLGNTWREERICDSGCLFSFEPYFSHLIDEMDLSNTGCPTAQSILPLTTPS